MIESLAGVWKEYAAALWLIGVASALMLVVSALVTPFVIVNLPPDYFTRTGFPERRLFADRPLLRVPFLVLKNTLGAVLLLAGILMLFLPGQGILTILCALAILDFPGKRGLERRIVRYPAVLGAVNWLRRRAGKEHFRV